VVDPRGMGDAELFRPGPEPLRHACVIFGRRGHLPSHEEEHGVEDGNALGNAAEFGKAGDDVGKYLGEGVGEGSMRWVEERGNGRVSRPENLLGREALAETLAAFGEKILEQAVERARWGAVLDVRL